MSEEGNDELTSGFRPLNQCREEYGRLSGLAVDPKRLQYYRVLVSYMSVVICGGTGYRGSRGGKTHQEVVVPWLAMIMHSICQQVRETLEEGLSWFPVTISHYTLRSSGLPPTYAPRTRSADRRVGKECVSTCRYQCSL